MDCLSSSRTPMRDVEGFRALILHSRQFAGVYYERERKALWAIHTEQ